jgi:hypothetical protein
LKRRINAMRYFKENYLISVLVAVLAISILTIGLLIVSSNKYEDDISNLRIENKKLQHQLQTSYNTIYDLRNENQECEYYIVPTEDGFVIDGQLYEKVEGYEAYE